MEALCAMRCQSDRLPIHLPVSVSFLSRCIELCMPFKVCNITKHLQIQCQDLSFSKETAILEQIKNTLQYNPMRNKHEDITKLFCSLCFFFNHSDLEKLNTFKSENEAILEANIESIKNFH